MSCTIIFQKYPVRFGAGECKNDSGPSIPVVYDTGDKDSTTKLYGITVKGVYHNKTHK